MGNGVGPAGLALWVAWVPVSEANRRDHWSARHRRALAAAAAFGEAVADLGEVRERLRDRLGLSSSRSSVCAASDSTTTTWPVDARPCVTPSPGGLASTTGTAGSNGDTSRPSGHPSAPSF